MIDYKIISESIDFYEKKGFTRIESPWTVSKYVDDITRPIDAIPLELKHNDKCLVGSGEQSFLYLYLKEYLPKGQFQTTTPCFRSDNFDLTHTKYFIKNELIKTDIVNVPELSKILDNATEFFLNYLPNVDIIDTPIGFDIEFNGVELGSYGIRHNDGLSWIYGTACAEPRLSKIIKNGVS